MALLTKILNVIAVFLSIWLFAGMALVVYGLAGADHRVKALCEAIRPGTSYEAAIAYGKENGFLVPKDMPANRTLLLLAEKRSMGRYGCNIEMAGGVVESVKVYYLD